MQTATVVRRQGEIFGLNDFATWFGVPVSAVVRAIETGALDAAHGLIEGKVPRIDRNAFLRSYGPKNN